MRIGLLITALAAASQPACKGCGDKPPVARLIDHQGDVQKSREGAFSPVVGKDAFHCGESLRTGPGSWARVEIERRGRIRLEEDTLIRFSCSGQQMGFDLEVGEASIVAAELGVEVGDAVLVGDSEVQARARGGVLTFDVLVGQARIRSPEGTDEAFGAGQSFEIDVGLARIREVRADAAVQDEADAGVDAGVDAGIDAGPDSPPGVIATISGRRNRVRSPDGKRFTRLAEGEQPLQPGTAVRLVRRGKAELTRGGERITVDGPAAFVIGGPDAELLSASRGQATLRATTEPVRARVPGGVVEALPGRGAGSRARVAVERRRTRVRPLAGRATVTGKEGERETLEIGERVTLTHQGRIEIAGRAPSRADVIVDAGESSTIHDPTPPTAVGFSFADKCEESGGEGIVEVSPRRSFSGETRISKGTGRANALLDYRRSHYYRIRCLVDGSPARNAVARGRVRVLRDRASRRLPRGAPRNTVEADGRLWSLDYQNRLPDITFVWPRVSGEGPYRLHLRRDGQAVKVETSSTPRVRLESGTVAEGTYEYYFERGGERSKTSILRVAFDNAAPSAYLRLPRVGQAWTGDTLEVAGAALPGSTITVAGTEVATDRQGRFARQVPLPVKSGAIAIRTSHPRLGVHYYLRKNRAR